MGFDLLAGHMARSTNREEVLSTYGHLRDDGDHPERRKERQEAEEAWRRDRRQEEELRRTTRETSDHEKHQELRQKLGLGEYPPTLWNRTTPLSTQAWFAEAYPGSPAVPGWRARELFASANAPPPLSTPLPPMISAVISFGAIDTEMEVSRVVGFKRRLCWRARSSPRCGTDTQVVATVVTMSSR